MWHTLLTVVGVTAAAIAFTLAAGKALAARREPAFPVRLAASSLFSAGIVFLLGTPAVYSAVDAAFGAPHLAALLGNAAGLLCVGHAHLMAMLWDPGHRGGGALRRTVLAWAPLYAGTILALVVLYALADPAGGTRPLLFAPDYVDSPQVVAFHLVTFAALIVAIRATVLRCRALLAPQGPPLSPRLRRCVREFALAIALELAHVGCVAAAMIGAACGLGLDGLAEAAWLATAVSGLVAHCSLVRLSLAARRQERRDHQTLRPLWQTVVRADPRLVLAPGLLWGGWDTRIALSRRLVEIRDGARSLSPWMSSAPARAVEQLARRGLLGFDLVAAQAAATLLYAADARGEGRPPTDSDMLLAALPGEDVPAAAERAHLVLVARHLDNPVVLEALAMARRERSAAGAGRR
ncbi:MAB_1171c family putative transporter [Streptomyces aurantiacus]|uniref:MAB_1171c family putative transporter n=1 Tax=Streptomyces aurantiacus TaxID=47760 RepID=UPI003323479B